MKVITPELIKGKNVLLRLDIDVPIKDGVVVDDFRLRAATPTVLMCLQHAERTTIIGHIGRPNGRYVPELSIEPIFDWFTDQGFSELLESKKLQILENLRFEEGEDLSDPVFAKSLAEFGRVYINEAFASHHPAVSTTVLPQLMPHAAGLRFAKEVEVLTKLRNHPDKPLVVIIGGVKLEDKLPAVLALSGVADAILVGGKVGRQLKQGGYALGSHIIIGRLNEAGTDLTPEAVLSWQYLISSAKTIIWNGPLGLVEDSQNSQTKVVAQMVIDSGAFSVVGGGDTINALREWEIIDRFSFVSTGGGAMLKFLAEGRLATIEALS